MPSLFHGYTFGLSCNVWKYFDVPTSDRLVWSPTTLPLSLLTEQGWLTWSAVRGEMVSISHFVSGAMPHVIRLPSGTTGRHPTGCLAVAVSHFTEPARLRLSSWKYKYACLCPDVYALLFYIIIVIYPLALCSPPPSHTVAYPHYHWEANHCSWCYLFIYLFFDHHL